MSTATRQERWLKNHPDLVDVKLWITKRSKEMLKAKATLESKSMGQVLMDLLNENVRESEDLNVASEEGGDHGFVLIR